MLKRVYGVELLDSLFDVANGISQQLHKDALAKFGAGSFAPVTIVHGDMLEVDWSNADIVYSASVCFPDELIDRITNKCEQLKKGSRIITLKQYPDRPYLIMKYALKLKMTWGRCFVYIYIRC